MKLRIGIFLGCPRNNGGTHQYSQSLLEAVALLPGDRFESVALCAEREWAEIAAGFGVPAFEASPGRVEKMLSGAWLHLRFPLAGWHRALAPMQATYRLMRSLRCDVWLFPGHDRWSCFWPLTSVASIHDLMHRYEPRFPEVSEVNRIRDLHTQAVARYCRAVLVDSECGRQQFCESYGAAPERVLPLPFVAPPYVRSAALERPAPRPADLPARYFFYPAQFWLHKNHARLLRVLARLIPEYPDMMLLLAGGLSREHGNLLRLAHELGIPDHVRFLGYVPDSEICTLYRHARALVMPTFFGPTNIPPLEAFALGCPVAISDIYGMPEQLGDAALMFDPESEDEMAEVMTRLWVDDRLCAELAERGTRHAARWNVAALSRQLGEMLPRLAHDTA